MIPSVPTIEIRQLVEQDIPRLPQIRPTYTTESILSLDRRGEGLEWTWSLAEKRLNKPFNRGTAYNFDADMQGMISDRLAKPDATYQRVADFEGLLVGIVEVEIQEWNNTAFVWNLMVDLDYRRNGIGRRLWHRARDFAKGMGVRAMMIETQNTNVAACCFYQRMGCTLVGLNEAMYVNNGVVEEFALFWAYFF
jgi:ribosomal protein S18 acetylase RimI-like enzyme